jgi:nicotinate-nucleotide adenylyltransferase
MRELRVLYGGTFDPVHEGHLAIARDARDALDACIRLMPAADPPHRPPPGADASDRVAMLRLALQGERGLDLDLRELERDGRSWSVDTLRALRGSHGDDAPVALLLGADSFAGLPTWKDWQALFDLAHFVVARREGSPLGDGLPPVLAACLVGRTTDDPADLRRAAAGRVLYLQQPLHAQSATRIRWLVANGGPWQGMVPAPVAAYIESRGLYRSGIIGP